MALPAPLAYFAKWVTGDQRAKAAFSSEQEAYDFCQRIYRETGGVTPELRRAYEYYRQNFNAKRRTSAGHRAP